LSTLRRVDVWSWMCSGAMTFILIDALSRQNRLLKIRGGSNSRLTHFSLDPVQTSRTVR
jgi:hypothetical protein